MNRTILRAIAPAAAMAVTLASVRSPGAAYSPKLIKACSAKWTRRISTCSAVLQQGLEIGISNSVVIPPAAAARVSLSTVPRSG